jgi:23S rRNA pseudouridine2605 synthase
MALERLQKIIAAAGIASRRKAEELIQSGVVSVNGTTITELGSKADPQTDSIRVNNKLLKGAERHEYIALNKPRGYVTTVSDPESRPTVMELVRTKARLYPIGRLDFNSEGLLLLTNDGDLAHKLMKAASHIPKTYLVKVAGQPEEEQLRRLRAGVTIAEERDPKRRVRTAPAQIRVIKEADNPWLEVTLHEGRNRQIRKMFEEIGHHVEKIRRVRYGPLELDLAPGESRLLSAKEISLLQRATEPQPRRSFKTERERRPDREFKRLERPFRGREKRREARTDDTRREYPQKRKGFPQPANRERFPSRPQFKSSPPPFNKGGRAEWPRRDDAQARLFDRGSRRNELPQGTDQNRGRAGDERRKPFFTSGGKRLDGQNRERDEEARFSRQGKKRRDSEPHPKAGAGRPRPGFS